MPPRVLLFPIVLALAALVLGAEPPTVALWRRIDSAPGGVIPPPPGGGFQATAALALDVDGDRTDEFVVAGRNGTPAIQLWRRSREREAWTREVIEPEALRIEAGGAAFDLDADGDPDVVFGGDGTSGELWWWENPGASGRRWPRHTIKAGGARKHHDQLCGDFTGSGRPALVSWNQGARALLRFAIPAEPRDARAWQAETIYDWPAGAREHEGLAAADVDRDGVLDLVGGGRWFRHAGEGRFTAEIVDPTMNFTRAAAGQFVSGGRPELVFVPGDRDGSLDWYEWTGAAWRAHPLLPHVVHGHSLVVADFNRDGCDDILVGEMGQWNNRVNHPTASVRILYGDGRGGFRLQVVAVGQGVHEMRVGDFDGDGRPDLLGKAYRHHAPRLVVWLNRGAVPAPLALDRWAPRLLDADTAAGKRVCVQAADLDGDGRLDLASGRFWYRNPGRLDAAWPRAAVGGRFGNLAVVADFDGDGAADLLGTAGDGGSPPNGGRFVLARNEGAGRFHVRDDLPVSEGDFLQGVLAAPLVDGQQTVVLSWHARTLGHLEVLRRAAGEAAAPWQLATFFPFTLREQLSPGDIDRDSRADLLLGTHWLRNGPEGWTRHEIGPVRDLDPKGEADRNALVDLNGDGWLDAVVALEHGTHVVWFENPGEAGSPWPRRIIGQSAGQGFSLDVGDPDLDGDADVLVGEHRNPERKNRVLLFENLDGRGGAWRQRVLHEGPASEIDHHNGTQFADLDGDGDLDIHSIGWRQPKLWVFENLAVDGAAAPSANDGQAAQRRR